MAEVRMALREARKAAKLTVEQAAQLAGYKSKSGWAMVETGVNDPSIEQMKRMAAAVGKQVYEVFPTVLELLPHTQEVTGCVGSDQSGSEVPVCGERDAG